MAWIVEEFFGFFLISNWLFPNQVSDYGNYKGPFSRNLSRDRQETNRPVITKTCSSRVYSRNMRPFYFVSKTNLCGENHAGESLDVVFLGILIFNKSEPPSNFSKGATHNRFQSMNMTNLPFAALSNRNLVFNWNKRLSNIATLCSADTFLWVLSVKNCAQHQQQPEMEHKFLKALELFTHDSASPREATN